MAGKRTATSELNHDNWDQDEPVEEAGTFTRASEDVIKKRVIKTAKRRNPISSASGEEGEKKNIFGGFTAFAKKPLPQNNAFSFLSSIDKNNQATKTNGVANNSKEKPESDEKVENKSTKNNLQKPIMNTSDDDKSNYYAKLKGLNESVSKWIKDHVDKNPFVNLQPIFKDYEKYYEDLEKEHKNKDKETKSEVAADNSFGSFKFTPAENTNVVTSTTFSFGSNKQLPNNKKQDITPTFTFGSSNVTKDSTTKVDPPTSTTLSSNKPEFKFGSGTTVTTTTSTFSFNSSSTASATTSSSTLPTFSFGNSNVSGAFKFGNAPSTGFTFAGVTTTNPTPNNDKNNKDANEEESDEPPKNEFTPVIEKDHLYTIRCKVFVKKDKIFGDRGVGNLYLKSIPDSEKVQLIVRADTNLGNLLCNFVLSESIPTQRMGKKDVMLVCIPTPESKPPPTPILLRVRSPEDADELLATLEKHKK